MTAKEIIDMVDDLSPNHYTEAQKLGWLKSVDGKIFHEVILTHYSAPWDMPVWDEESFSADSEMIVQAPYAEDLYTYYLMSRIAAANSEVAKYDQFASLYNQAFSDWANWYNRTRIPVKKGRWIL